MTENIEASGGMSDDWASAFAEQNGGKEAAKPPAPAREAAQPPARAMQFGPLSAAGASPGNSNLDLILDIPVTISVELGKTKMLIKDLLQLGQGAVVELEKLAGEPIEILVNGRLIARGEAVVVNEKFGVKLTDVVSPSERITKLK